jgi:serine protease Do
LSSQRKIGVVALFAALAASGAASWSVWRDQPAPAPQGRMAARELGDPTAAAALGQAFRQAAQGVMQSVVHVQVRGVRREAAAVQSFGMPSDPGGQLTGAGSGFFFRPDGYILTNNHVIDGAAQVTVVLQDRREYEADVVGRDPNTDIAVLRIDAADLPAVVIGDSDGLEVGDWVVALGYPLQLGATATAGIVSALGRSIGILGQSREASAPLESFIQTDAAINPGNSGGPLVDLGGNVIGVNSAIASPTGFYSGYGFAIPIRLAERIANDLIEYGEVHRPQLGVEIDDVDPADAEIYGLGAPIGVEVVQLVSESPAERAGVELGDVITHVDGTAITGGGHLMELLARNEPGRVVQLALVRYGRKLDVDVELGEFEPAVRTGDLARQPSSPGLGRLGFAAADLTPEVARNLGMTSERGVVISQIDPAGAAYRARLRAGYVLEQFNGRRIASIAELRDATAGLRAGQAVSLIVREPDGQRLIINYRVRG